LGAGSKEISVFGGSGLGVDNAGFTGSKTVGFLVSTGVAGFFCSLFFSSS
jgi:hypothetical protein